MSLRLEIGDGQGLRAWAWPKLHKYDFDLILFLYYNSISSFLVFGHGQWFYLIFHFHPKFHVISLKIVKISHCRPCHRHQWLSLDDATFISNQSNDRKFKENGFHQFYLLSYNISFKVFVLFHWKDSCYLLWVHHMNGIWGLEFALYHNWNNFWHFEHICFPTFIIS